MGHADVGLSPSPIISVGISGPGLNSSPLGAKNPSVFAYTVSQYDLSVWEGRAHHELPLVQVLAHKGGGEIRAVPSGGQWGR